MCALIGITDEHSGAPPDKKPVANPRQRAFPAMLSLAWHWID